MNFPPRFFPIRPPRATTLAVCALLGLPPALAPAQPTVPVEPPAPWSDPVFINRFLGTYGARSDIEPRVSAAEQELLRNLLPQIENDPEAAADALERELRADSSAALDFTLGNLRYQTDRPEAAARHYREALRKFPDFARARQNLGLALVRSGDFAGAIAPLAAAIGLGGGNGNLFGVLGYAHLQNNRPHSAEAAYRQALMLDPDNDNWRLGLVQSLQVQERHRETLALLDELLADRPDRVETWLIQANTFLALDEPRRTAANLEMARRLGSATVPVLLSLGEIYINDGLAAPAVERLGEALATDPEAAFSRAARAAEALALRGETVHAADLLRRLREHSAAVPDPKAGDRLLLTEARIAMEEDREADAARQLEDLLDRDPTHGEAHLLLAEIRARGDEWEKAEILLERAARLPDYAARAHRRHGELLAAQRRYAEAAEQLRLALNLRPDESLARYLTQIERLAELD